MLSSEAAYGTQFLYMRVPALGSEAHPFSLAAMRPSFIIKCNGDWTQRLHDLAVTQATASLIADAAQKGTVLHPEDISLNQLTKVTTKIVCEVDGVYGNASPPWRSFSHVLYIGGGVGVTPWLAAMEEHREVCSGTDGADQTMRLVWIGRNFTDLDAFVPYLPKMNTAVYLTRLAKRSRAVSVRSQTDESSAQTPESTPKSVPSTQDKIRIEKPLPWIPALVGIASLFLTQLSYTYINGDNSDPTLNGSTQWRYFWTKALPVLCSFASIAVSALTVRWASRSSLFSSCPCFKSSSDPAAVRPLQPSFSQIGRAHV